MKDLARLFMVHPKTVSRWLRRIKHPRVQPSRRTLRYSNRTLTLLASLAATPPDE